MATLTASGVNCSNGTLDGFYTGSTSTNTTYPIGSYLFARFQGISYTNNAAVAVTNLSGSDFGAGGTAVAGTWRTRGGTPGIQLPCIGTFYLYVVQRVA